MSERDRPLEGVAPWPNQTKGAISEPGLAHRWAPGGPRREACPFRPLVAGVSVTLASTGAGGFTLVWRHPDGGTRSRLAPVWILGGRGLCITGKFLCSP